MSETAPLSIRGLGHRYGENPALHGVDLELQSGEFVALLGPSGCGKTTLLRAVAGLLCPSEGSITLNGRTVCEDGRERVPTEARGIGLVFQEYALFPHMTVRENVGFGVQETATDRVDQLLDSVGLLDLADRKPAQLSGGQQQRAALARALAPQPGLLLLDEPFANVDAARRDALGKRLHRIVRDQGASALLVTHDQHSALALADRVLVLESSAIGGVAQQLGTPDEIYQRPNSRAVARSTGQCHFLAGTATGDSAETAMGVVALMEPCEGDVTLAVRPHQMRFRPSSEGSVTVQARHYVGPVYHLVCEAFGASLEVDWPADAPPPAIGARGHLEATHPWWALPTE